MGARLAALLLAGTAGGVGGPADVAHPAALSHLRLVFAPDVVRAELSMQELTLREMPHKHFDRDADGRISTLELEAGWTALQESIAATTWFECGGARHAPVWTIAGYEERGVELEGGGSHFERVIARAEIPRPAGAAALAVHSDLFLEEGNPEHRLLVTVEGLYPRTLETFLSYGRRDWQVDVPVPGGVLRDYLLLGFEHVLLGWDHLAFVAALLFGVAGAASLLAAVTAFTLAHSLTLAAAALGLWTLPPALVEPAIACSVLLVLLAHLRTGADRARAWLPAFAFGLLHGFGFAGVLGDIGLPTEHRALGLLGFNLGVEAGQLACVAPLAALAFALRRWAPAAWPALRRTAALLLLAFAAHLVAGAARAWWWTSAAPLPEPWLEAALGAAALVLGAAAIRLTIARRTPPAERLRPFAAQAALLLLCYAAGVSLAGLRGESGPLS